MGQKNRPISAFFCLLVLLLGPLSGCFSDKIEEENVQEPSRWLPDVENRSKMVYEDSDDFSRVSKNGTFGTLPVQSVFVDVPAITAADGGAGLTGNPMVHMGLWLPEIEGCDYSSEVVDEQCKVPVIAEVGPYYSDGDVSATEPANRLGRFLIENFVPHGYGVAQVSVFGTGESNHCMDLMGLDEQAGIHAAVEWLGQQSWSNGNVGMIGKSYDGSTPWNAATAGSSHLKTIVPMSGLIGVHELMWRNGSMEARGAIMHNGVYGSFGLDGDLEDVENACEGYVEGYYAGVGAYMSGDDLSWTGSDYWEERYFLDKAIENYNGSVYIIHGMQDWNVDPHMAFPTHNIMLEHGFEVKGLYGQWAHDYPDRIEGHSALSPGRGAEAYPHTLRWDWADDLLEWFDYYLKNKGIAPRLHAEIQDNIGGWRVEAEYPPLDQNWIDLSLGGDGCSLSSGSALVTSSSSTVLDCPMFESETRIIGTPTLSLQTTISPTATSGHIFVEMVQTSSGMHLGHAVMDLRFYAGGKDAQVLLPGSTVIAQMEFFGMDVVIPQGDGVSLIITQTGEDYVPSPPSISPVTIGIDGESVLSLSSVSRTCDDLFLPPMQEWYDFCA